MYDFHNNNGEDEEADGEVGSGEERRQNEII
jgi:hypothetical protein